MSYKQFSSITEYAVQDHSRPRACGSCGMIATKEITFNVRDNNISAVERYCASCAGVIVKESA